MRPLSLIAIGIVLMMPGWLDAQSARVSGTVLDQSGAWIPNATVTLRKGAEAQTTTTNANGAFSFDKVEAGTYDVDAEQPGFKTETVRVVVPAMTIITSFPQPRGLRGLDATRCRGRDMRNTIFAGSAISKSR